jgi:ABC-type phosphate/phosphonate transport system substrate-binding protein
MVRFVLLTLLGLAVGTHPCLLAADPVHDASARSKPVLKVGAVAYAPDSVTIWEGIRRYSERGGLPIDYVLYSNYDALVESLAKGEVDVAWNTPLAHAQVHLKTGGRCRTLAMRDVDLSVRCVLLVRKEAGIAKPTDLVGKTLILGSRDAAEATVLPVHYLQRDGVEFGKVKVLSLDREVDLKGNPCSSERHVLQALLQERGDAGIISERSWHQLGKTKTAEAQKLRLVWTSPSFSHCVFTAREGLKEELGDRFTKLMLAMDPADPLTADAMRLEGTRRWVIGSPEGFADLIQALRKSAP